MVEFIETEIEQVLALHVTGTFSRQDYDTLQAALHERSAAQANLNLYWEMTELTRLPAPSLRQKLEDQLQQLTGFQKIALVRDLSWLRALPHTIEPTAHLRAFAYEDRDAAREWVGL